MPGQTQGGLDVGATRTGVLRLRSLLGERLLEATETARGVEQGVMHACAGTGKAVRFLSPEGCKAQMPVACPLTELAMPCFPHRLPGSR